MNDWVDSNALFTMGKAMFNGKVLYRDVFDHKGPILHFLHGLAWLISHNSFFGVWLLEIIACYFTLLFSYRILELYTDKKAILMMPVFAIILYTTKAMCHGDSAEELCLPWLMYAVFVVVKSLKEKEDICPKALFLIGVTSGCILWIKYTMLGFYVGWVVVPLYFAIKNKNWNYIRNMVLFIGAGVLTITLPVLLYFLVNGALYDLWDTYFYTNLFKYTSSEYNLDQVGPYGRFLLFKSTVLEMATANLGVLILLIVGGCWAFAKRKFTLIAQIALMLLGGLLAVYSKLLAFPYYAMIFCGFSVFGLIPVYSRVSIIFAKWNCKIYAGVFVILCALILPFTHQRSANSYMLKYEKGDLPQYKFAEIINQKENATVLNYGFLDGGFYTAAGSIPNVRYFCVMNTHSSEALEAQKEAIQNRTVDFVITKEEKLDSPWYEEEMTASFFFEVGEYEYTLYARKAA
jgi:hypothetical protein